jgi:hypothetical protein
MSEAMKTITIKLPAWMLAELRERAELQGVEVTELIRRGVSLDRLVRDHVSEGRTVTIHQGPDDPHPTFTIDAGPPEDPS